MDNKLSALLLFALLAQGLAFALSSYDQSCTSDPDCIAGLICDSGKCNQPAGMCSNPPEIYTPAPPAAGGGGPPALIETRISETETGTGTAVVKSTSGIYKVGWFSDWKAISFVGVAIVMVIISIAAMLGKAFNINELKAFANAELSQAIVSVVLIVALIGLVVFFDEIARLAIVQAQLPVQCTDMGPNPPPNAEPCYITAAKEYLETLCGTANDAAKNNLEESVRQQRAASVGMFMNVNIFKGAYIGSSMRFAPGLSIQAERAAALFNILSKIMASVYAQKFFIDVVTFALAPVLLLLGIILRTFFFTRKLGGLLLAIAIALFIVYPLTFAFAWFTLNVTVYGDRMLGASDPDCPAECMKTYPVAFFVEPSGQIKQFSTTQSLMLSGITDANWATGDVNGDGTSEFPGLVACRDLTPAKIPSAASACQDCPDYCREVPFPTGFADCSISKCADCNAGCKIMRQRTDCASTCASCPPDCLVKKPVEDKCYLDADAQVGTVPADLSVDCRGCDAYPVWCRYIKKDASGNDVPYYPDSACSNIVADCPKKCLYYNDVGQSYDCDAACTVSGTTCPKFCRVTEIKDAAWMLAHNVLPPDFDSECNKGAIKAACDACPAKCKVEAGASFGDPAFCAAYPKTTDKVEKCLDCPKYCRFNNYDFVLPDISHLNMVPGDPRTPSSVPAECVQGYGGVVACSKTTAPPECGAGCFASASPPMCLEYDASLPTTQYCSKCPPQVRIKLSFDPGGNQQSLPFSGRTKEGTFMFDPPSQPSGQGVIITDPEIKTSFKCDAANCDEANCKKVLILPNTGICLTNTCPVGCRITGTNINNYLKAECYDETNYPVTAVPCNNAAFTSACKINIDLPVNQGNVCAEFHGTGEPACFTSDCYKRAQPECPVPSKCEWNAPHQACVSTNNVCESTLTQTACSQASGCRWDNPPPIPIGERLPPYDDPTQCKQCPENCRIIGLGLCGLEDDGSGTIIDCGAASCPNLCKIPALPAPPSAPNCMDDTVSKSCYKCPALCRRNPSQFTGYSDFEDKCTDGKCSEERCNREGCGLVDNPRFMCEGCFDCEEDCTFNPYIRTDCSEVCSDEALAGPVNIAPDDFIKKLPGATSKEDVKAVGGLMLPALVLPLFCIVIMVATIRVLSPVLGGDIEIPGLGKII